jgi:hydrogenase maturation protease
MRAPEATRKRTPLRIIGLGNELLSDDGAGVRVVQELKRRIPVDNTIVEELPVGGLQLLEHISGVQRCIIIDAVVTGDHPPGTAYRSVQTDDGEPVSLASSHQVDLGQVLSLLRLLGGDPPGTLLVYGIEAGDITTFRETCTEEVSRAIPEVAELICRDLANAGLAFSNPTGEWEVIREPVSV